jgi:hypothetical protein
MLFTILSTTSRSSLSATLGDFKKIFSVRELGNPDIIAEYYHQLIMTNY